MPELPVKLFEERSVLHEEILGAFHKRTCIIILGFLKNQRINKVG